MVEHFWPTVLSALVVVSCAAFLALTDDSPSFPETRAEKVTGWLAMTGAGLFLVLSVCLVEVGRLASFAAFCSCLACVVACAVRKDVAKAALSAKGRVSAWIS